MTSLETQISMLEMIELTGVRFGTSGVRGLVEAMTDEVCFAYTSAFLQIISLPPGSPVALGIDLRPSSPRIAAACAAAIRRAGYRVEYCGQIPTPALALHAQQEHMPALMVTGSHIPFDRNGIKFYKASGEIGKQDEADIVAARITLPERIASEDLPRVNHQAKRTYAGRYLDFFAPGSLEGMTLGFYEHSSVARDLMREILESLGAKVVSLGRTDDFVPIDTEAVGQADIERAQRWASEYGFDAIISTDGDADRPLVGDENGQWLRGDVTGILTAQYLRAHAVVTTVSCNTAAELCGSFRKVVRTRIGSPYVIGGIENRVLTGEQRVVGFEPNGGFLLGSPFENGRGVLQPLLTRDAVLPVVCLLSMARERGCKVSELQLGLPQRFTASDRLQDVPAEMSQKVLLKLSSEMTAIDAFLDGLCGRANSLDQTDGLRIFLENEEIVHFRPSGNAPELRCYAESSDQERSKILVSESLSRLKVVLDSLKVQR